MRKFIKKITIYLFLSLISIYSLSSFTNTKSFNADTINTGDQIKIIDKNIKLIKALHGKKSDSILFLAKQTLDLSQKQKYLEGINNSQYYIARIFDLRNNSDSASHYYILGLENDILDKNLYASYLMSLAENQRLTGNLSYSLEKALLLKTLVENNQTKKYAYQVYNLLALNYTTLMQYDLAFENFSKSAELALINGNEAYAGVIYSNIGNLFYKQFKLNEALNYFEKGTKLEEKHELYQSLANSYNIIADIYLKLNDLDQTRFYLKKAKTIHLRTNFERGLANTYFEYSKVFVKENEIDSALVYLEKTLKIANKQNNKTLLKDVYFSFSEIYAKMKDFEKAFYFHDLFFKLHNKIYDVAKISKVKSIEHELIQKAKKTELVELELKKQKTINLLFIALFSIVAITSIIIALYLFKVKKLNKELIVSKEKAEESDVLKSEFLKTISHEIRTPLNGIIGFTDLIISKELQKKELKDIQEYIFKNSQELTSTIENIVDMAHLSSKQYHIHKTEIKVSTLFNKILSQINEGFLYDHKKNIEIGIDLKNDFEINTDKNNLRKVILQLVKNALKYTDEGKITIGCYQEDNETVLYVRDTGIGIRQEKLNIIFSPFRQVGGNTNIKTGGVGLGLTIVKELVAILEGKIRVESEVNKGSTFYISIPNK